MKRALVYLFVSLVIVGCGDQKIDTTKAREEMEAREIKVVSDARIIEEAQKIGDLISREFKISAANDKLDALRVDYGTDSLFEKNYYFFEDPKDLQGKALELFEAYKYNRDNGLEPFSNVQKLDNGETLLYTNAMLLNDTTFAGIWTIRIPRKHVVLNIKD